MKTPWHWLRLFLVTGLLLAAAWFGIKDGFDGLRDAQTSRQRTAAMFQMLYGVAALVSLVVATLVCWGALAQAGAKATATG